MNVLPRLLYPVQMIPILFNHKVVRQVNGWFSSFIWSKRRPRIRLSVLQSSSVKGGMGLPDVQRYQLSAHLRYIADWVKNDASSIWLDIEKYLCYCPLKHLLFINKLKCVKKLCNNPVTINTVRAWRITWHMEGRSGLTSVFIPITDNPDFLPGTLGSAFKWLRELFPSVISFLVLPSCSSIRLWKNMTYQGMISSVSSKDSALSSCCP